MFRQFVIFLWLLVLKGCCGLYIEAHPSTSKFTDSASVVLKNLHCVFLRSVFLKNLNCVFLRSVFLKDLNCVCLRSVMVKLGFPG